MFINTMKEDYKYIQIVAGFGNTKVTNISFLMVSSHISKYTPCLKCQVPMLRAVPHSSTSQIQLPAFVPATLVLPCIPSFSVHVWGAGMDESISHCLSVAG